MSHSHTPTPPALRRRALCAAVTAACTLMAQTAVRAGLIDFTGNAPVYTATWFNGVFTEFHEFQFFLDWQGFCNAHFGAECGSATFWGVPFNWNLNRVPGLADDVRTPIGSVVSINSYSSIYKGLISGTATAGTLTAQGQIRIGPGGLLRTDNGVIADLFLGGGVLETNGLVTVTNLSQTLGNLQGSGITRVTGVTAVTFDPFIRAGHTVEFYASYGGMFGGSFGSTGPRLEAGTGNVFNPGPSARLINYGTLDDAVLLMQGSANVATLPRLINRGTLSGGLNPNAVRVDNEGTAQLGSGGAMSFGPAGAHTGSFIAGLNSVLTFGGPWGHDLMPASSLSTTGKVIFAAGVHKVRGSYDAHETELQGATGNGFLDFTGASVSLDILRVDAGQGGQLKFLTPGGVGLQELHINSGEVIFETGAPNARTLSSVQSLAMSGGTLTANSPVDLVNTFQWNAGNIAGSAGVTALGGIEINATAALNRGLFGLLRNSGVTNWHGGVINWGGTFENLAGATFNVSGDFSAGSNGFGRFVNAGSVNKTAGSGVATLGMAFDNNGLVQVDAGTLRLNGGGTHRGGQFQAAPGALIELSGNTVLQAAVTTSGRVDITGGSLTLGNGASYTNLPGNSVSGASLANAGGATFVNHGSLNVSGTLNNEGLFTNHHPGSSLGAVVNAGTFNNIGNLNVLGDVSNSNALNNIGSLAINGGLVNTGNFRNDGLSSQTTVAGVFSSLGGTLDNEGSLVFQGGDVELSGVLTNLGQIHNGGGLFTVAGGASLVNHGSVLNDGGQVFVDTGGLLGGTGSYVQSGGLTWIRGELRADAGIDIQGGILRGGTPPNSTITGIGTVIGNVELHGQPWRWEPGNSPGTFTVTGNVMAQGDAFRAPGEGNIAIEIDSPALHDRIVVSGIFTLHEASVDLIFSPGFTGLDGDSLDWLSAGVLDLPNGPGSVVFNVSGLSADWAAMPSFGASGAGLEMINLLAAPIPVAGASHRVDAGVQAYNESFAVLDSLAVGGNLSNRRGGFVTVGDLNVEAGGRLLNRGFLQTTVQVVNAGELLNRRDGQFLQDGFVNTGSVVNEGQFSSASAFLNQGGSVVNRGVFQTWGFTNAAGGVLENSGAFTHTGQFVNEAGGRVVNRGTMTAEGQIVNRGEFVVSGSLQNNATTLGPAFFTGSILNQGSFVVEPGGAVGGPGTYFQAGVDSVTRVNGTLAASDITILQGVLAGNGTVAGPVQLGSAAGAGATMSPGNSPGTLTLDGDLLAHYSAFEIELAGPGLFDHVVVTGNASFGSGVTVNFLLSTPDGVTFDYYPTAGDGFTWLSVGGAASGLAGLNWSLSVLGPGWTTTLASGAWGSTSWNGMQIGFHGDRIEFVAAPVPEPGAWALLLAGLGAIGVMVRRRGLQAAA